MVSEEDKIKYRKSIAEFRLIDDTFMAVVFGGELQLSEMLLHTTIGNDKIRVVKSIGQYAIKNLEGHSSTLDIFCQDEQGRYFNVEVQRDSSGAVPQRARYHLGMIVRITQAMLGLTASENPGFFENLIFKYLYLTTPVAIVLLIVSIIVLYKTRFGLRLRACGEHPQAADSVGINVYKMRYAGVVISGVLGGIGGLAFTVAAGSGFQSSVAGYGFLALSVMIFGNWKPVNIMLASLFFALFKVIGGYKDYIPFLPKFSNITASENIYSMLPYILTMVVLIFTSRRSRAPKAEGIPYDKGAR